jgi:hypothetical protein
MRSVFILLVTILLISVGEVPAADSLQGTVVSIAPKSGQLILRSGSGQSVRVTMVDGLLPGFVKPGSSVTIWGRYVSAGGFFKARGIAPAGMVDPTGVRSRLKWKN